MSMHQLYRTHDKVQPHLKKPTEYKMPQRAAVVGGERHAWSVLLLNTTSNNLTNKVALPSSWEGPNKTDKLRRALTISCNSDSQQMTN